MTTGTIKNFLPGKKFGFIIGDDKKDYIFYTSTLSDSSQISQIAEGAMVEFDPTVTPKGYKATKVVIKSITDCTKYVVPDTVLLSKTDSVPGWEVLDESNWIVTASGRGNPNDVKKELKFLAKRIGANAVVYMNYQATTGSEGNYNFTLHNFTGRAVNIGKKSLSGNLSLKDFPDINATAENYKMICNNTYVKENAGYKNKLGICLAISIILAIAAKGAGLGIGFIVMVVAAISGRPQRDGEWLRKG